MYTHIGVCVSNRYSLFDYSGLVGLLNLRYDYNYTRCNKFKVFTECFSRKCPLESEKELAMAVRGKKFVI